MFKLDEERLGKKKNSGGENKGEKIKEECREFIVK